MCATLKIVVIKWKYTSIAYAYAFCLQSNIIHLNLKEKIDMKKLGRLSFLYLSVYSVWHMVSHIIYMKIDRKFISTYVKVTENVVLNHLDRIIQLQRNAIQQKQTRLFMELCLFRMQICIQVKQQYVPYGNWDILNKNNKKTTEIQNDSIHIKQC